jgi:hypothetical protein
MAPGVGCTLLQFGSSPFLTTLTPWSRPLSLLFKGGEAGDSIYDNDDNDDDDTGNIDDNVNDGDCLAQVSQFLAMCTSSFRLHKHLGCGVLRTGA